MDNIILTCINILFLIILIVLISIKKLPLWTLYVYIINLVLCMVMWEIWMSYGLINGDSSEERSGKGNNTVNMLLMSFGDAIVGFLQIYITYKIIGKDAFRKWNWKAFLLIFGIGMIINILITFLIISKIKNKKISVAPLMPYQTKSVVQIQEPWIIQPFIFYGILVASKLINR